VADAAPTAAEAVSGAGIAEEDTLTILDGANRQQRICLNRIDAEKAQPFGNVSRHNLARLAFGGDTVADCPCATAMVTRSARASEREGRWSRPA